MREQFEQWYCDKYWNFKSAGNRQVFFDVAKNSYNHFDVDLAYNAFIFGTETLRKLTVTHLRAVADSEMSIAEHKHCCEPSICYACRSDGINTVATHIENHREI